MEKEAITDCSLQGQTFGVCYAFELVVRGERCIDCYILAKWVWSSFLLRLQGLLALTTITPHETKCCPEKSEANATNLMTYSFFMNLLSWYFFLLAGLICL